MSREAQAATNRALADQFLELIFNRRDFAGASRLFAHDFTHHEPSIPRGAAGLLEHLAEIIDAHPNLRAEPVRHICDGDFVVLHNRRHDGELEMAAIDILRIADGKIAELWHVFQPVPETIANPNGMF